MLTHWNISVLACQYSLTELLAVVTPCLDETFFNICDYF